MWDEVDFLINRCFWSDKSHKNLKKNIRKNNLVDIINACNNHNFKIFLEGKTLASVFTINNFWPNDHDDDLGIFLEDSYIFFEKIVPLLTNQLNFEIIRRNDDMISLERKKRYVDICFFDKKEGNKVGYGKKKFKNKYYRKLIKIKRLNTTMFVPNNTLFFILKRYVFKFIYEVVRYFYLLFNRLIKTIQNHFKKKKILNLNEFLELKIESENSLNWKIRKPHLDLITDKGKYLKIKDLIYYLKKDFTLIEKKLLKSNVTKISDYPIHLNKSFWYNGNDFFFNCVKYEYRKRVVPYNKIRDYLESNPQHPIFSASYYSSLKLMDKKEI